MGARTRLGVAVVAHLLAAQHVPILAVRHAADAQALAEQYPGVQQFGPGAGSLPTCLVGDVAVRLLVCAFGPAHPARPGWKADAAAFSVDVALAGQVVASGNGPLHAVLVSSVLALSPTRDRCHYGGFKNLAESQLALALSARSASCLSVLYPGRLCPGPSLLGTAYTALARRVCAQAASPRAGARVLGCDARLWLLRQSLRGFGTAISAWVAAPSAAQRDGEPRT